MLQRVTNRFAEDEQGGLTNLALPMFLLLVITSGLAIDLAMNEQNRACLQNAMDRGVLAASSLTQNEDAGTVVNEYVNFQGCDDQQIAVTVTPTSTNASRRVQASAQFTQETAIMSLLPGVDTYDLPVPAMAEALEGIENVEISLVLDISGSMARNDSNNTSQKRLQVLRDSAKTFVTTLLTGQDRQNVSISLIPYSGHVNAGPFFDYFYSGGNNTAHDYSACIEFQDADYGNANLPAANSRGQVPSFQWFTFEGPGGRGHQADWGWCPNNNRGIVPFSKSITDLHAAIDGMRAHDGTGTQNGMKWGLGLLDPQIRPYVSTLTQTNRTAAASTFTSYPPALTNTSETSKVVNPLFAGRPVNYGKPGTQKIIVVMTDGNIRYQNRPDPAKFTSEKDADYWGEKAIVTTEYGYTFVENVMSFRWSGAGYNNPAFSVQPDFDLLNQDENLRTTQFLTLCQMAKDAGIRVFTIGFDISQTSDAYSEMNQCAATQEEIALNIKSADFFFVEGLDLGAAFNQIATLVQQLRLVR